MKYNVRQCPLKFDLEFGGCDGCQTCEFEINGEKHSWWLSYAMGDLFCSMLEIIYGLCIELVDQSNNDYVEYEFSNPDNSSYITAIKGKTIWDSEGEVLEWSFRRDLEKDDKMVDVMIDYQFGKKIYSGQFNLIDLCYAVSRALTNYIKQVGFCGYHFSANYDSVNILHFLVVKYYALTGDMKLYKEVGAQGQFISSFEEEMELLRHPM